MYYVDILKHNLLSISQLCDKGNKVSFTFAGYKVKKMDRKKTLLISKRHKNIYKVYIMGMLGTNLTCLSVIDCDSSVWNKRLGHVCLKQLTNFSSNDMVISLPKTKFKDNKVCSANVRGKQVRPSFNLKNKVSIDKCLDLVHMKLMSMHRNMVYNLVQHLNQ